MILLIFLQEIYVKKLLKTYRVTATKDDEINENFTFALN